MVVKALTLQAFSSILLGKAAMMTMMTGAEIVIRCLQEEKVDCVFGYPGGSVLHIYDALFKQDEVKHILVRHEQIGRAHV